MKTQTRMRARRTDGQIRVSVLVRHPMQGQGPDGGGEAHYIERMRFERNGALAADVYLGPGIAANPVTTITLRDARPGDRLAVTWNDNRGGSGHAETTAP